MSARIELRRQAKSSESMVISVLPLVGVGGVGDGLAADVRFRYIVAPTERYLGLEYFRLGHVVSHCFSQMTNPTTMSTM